MNLTAAIANSLWLTSSRPAFAGFQRALRRPSEAQTQLLKDYLAANADTAFGRYHGFVEIKTYEEFARRVPLAGYDGLEPWIKRIQSGEARVLTAEPVTRLVPTSGSTGARKLIPFTTGLQRELNQAIWGLDNGSLSAVSFYCPWQGVLVHFAGHSKDNSETSAVPIGFDDDSACLGAARKRLVDTVMAVPSEIRFVPDLEQFQYVTLLCLLRQPELRLISIWHPSFLLLLVRALPGFWDDLLRDIRGGGCRCAKSLPPAVLPALKLHPLPRCARRLATANPTEPETLWPNLKVISCWGDGHAALAKADLQRRFPSAVIQSKGLLATECFVTIPFAGSHPRL